MGIAKKTSARQAPPDKIHLLKIGLRA
jgi:hypothetical protein